MWPEPRVGARLGDRLEGEPCDTREFTNRLSAVLTEITNRLLIPDVDTRLFIEVTSEQGGTAKLRLYVDGEKTPSSCVIQRATGNLLSSAATVHTLPLSPSTKEFRIVGWGTASRSVRVTLDGANDAIKQVTPVG